MTVGQRLEHAGHGTRCHAQGLGNPPGGHRRLRFCLGQLVDGLQVVFDSERNHGRVPKHEQVGVACLVAGTPQTLV